jgi:hypothetical protein
MAAVKPEGVFYVNIVGAKVMPKKKAIAKQVAKFGTAKGRPVAAKAAKPGFLPHQPPAFEPVLSTAAQWRKAAIAVSK